MKRTLFPLVAAVFLLVHCKPEEQKVSNDEAKTFVKDLEAGALKRRSNLISSRLMLQALADRMMKEKDIKNMGSIQEGMKKGLGNAELDRNVYSTIGKSGSFENVKTYEKNGKQRAIFRVFGDEGLNYLDMELTKVENKVGVADIFVYTTGENLSKSMAELIGKMTDKANERKAEETVESFQAIKRLVSKGNFEQAKREFDRLPFYIKNTRIADIMNIQISSNLGEEVYMKEIEEFEKKYAGEPSLQLAMIDLHILRKDYEKALHSVDVLDSLINKDTFLDYYRGLINNAMAIPILL